MDKETGEYGPGVDRDTGADVGDTGTPEISAAVDSDSETDSDDGAVAEVRTDAGEESGDE